MGSDEAELVLGQGGPFQVQQPSPEQADQQLGPVVGGQTLPRRRSTVQVDAKVADQRRQFLFVRVRVSNQRAHHVRHRQLATGSMCRNEADCVGFFLGFFHRAA